MIPAVEPDEPPYQELIEGYCRFLRRDRGLAETTVVNYRRYLRDFLASRGDAVSPAELVALTAEDLLVFSRRAEPGWGAPRGTTWPRRCPAFTAGWTCRVTRQGIWSVRCRCGGVGLGGEVQRYARRLGSEGTPRLSKIRFARCPCSARRGARRPH